MKPTISVAMCTFNGEHFLREQLDSIAAQETLPDEFVICDDSSTDGTLEVLDTFARSAPFRVSITVNRHRLGSTVNLDQAIRLCNGEFIALCDQDDVWKPSKITRQIAALDSDPSYGGVFSDAELIDDIGKPTGKNLWQSHGLTFAHPPLERDAALRLLLKHDVVTGATLMFRASLRDKLLPIPLPWVHDGWLTWMIVLYSRMTFIAEPLLRYRVHARQQLGVRRASRRFFSSNGERDQLDHIIAEFEVLRTRWISRPGPEFTKCLALIHSKIAFLRRRKCLPAQSLRRLYAVVALLQRYQLYARGLSSVHNDLFSAD